MTVEKPSCEKSWKFEMLDSTLSDGTHDDRLEYKIRANHVGVVRYSCTVWDGVWSRITGKYREKNATVESIHHAKRLAMSAQVTT